MIEDTWADYKTRVARLLVWLVVGGVVACLIALAIGGTYPMAALVVMIAWIVGAGWSGAAISDFRCPRCKQTFFWKGWYANQLAQKCLHCGLRKWAHPLPGDRSGN